MFYCRPTLLPSETHLGLISRFIFDMVVTHLSLLLDADSVKQIPYKKSDVLEKGPNLDSLISLALRT